LPDKALVSIVDDDESVRNAIRRLMKSLGYAAKAFPSAVDFLASAHLLNTSCLIADIHMPQMTGLELHHRLIESGHAIPTILITAYPDDSIRVRALNDGVICYLSKPFDKEVLLGCVRAALEGAKPDKDHS
jgi:FixJ family two-component response regulator